MVFIVNEEMAGESSFLGEQRFDFLGVIGLGGGTLESFVDEADFAFAIDKVAGGHAWRAEDPCGLVANIVGDEEGGFLLGGKGFEVGVLVIHADGDDGQAFGGVFLVEAAHATE